MNIWCLCCCYCCCWCVTVCLLLVSSWWKISKDIIIVNQDSGWNELIVVVCNVNKSMWNVDGKDKVGTCNKNCTESMKFECKRFLKKRACEKVLILYVNALLCWNFVVLRVVCYVYKKRVSLKSTVHCVF